VVCRQWDQIIQAFPPKRAQEPLAQGIRLGTLRGRFQDPQSQVAYVLVELMRENAVVVMDQKAVGVVRWDRVAQLLQGPQRRGVRRHIDVQDTTCRVFHEYKDVEEPKGRRHHDAEVTGNDRLGMVVDKHPPALGGNMWPLPVVHVLRQVLPHGPR
jgi:hypothetical protein